MTHSNGCFRLVKAKIHQGTSGVYFNDETELTRVDKQVIDLCLNCPLTECKSKIRDDRRVLRGGK